MAWTSGQRDSNCSALLLARQSGHDFLGELGRDVEVSAGEIENERTGDDGHFDDPEFVLGTQHPGDGALANLREFALGHPGIDVSFALAKPGRVEQMTLLVRDTISERRTLWPRHQLRSNLWLQSRSEHQPPGIQGSEDAVRQHQALQILRALANEGGGILLLGVSDKPPRRVVGSAAFNDPVAMAEIIFKNVGFRVDIGEVAHPDGRVVVFHIPSRPRGTAYHLGGAYLMRSGEELVPMSEDRLRKIFAEGQPDWLEEPSRTGLTPPRGD